MSKNNGIKQNIEIDLQTFNKTLVPKTVATQTAADGIAVFDADGTLWHEDIAEDFARWMVSEGEFDANAWAAYEEINRQDIFLGAKQMLQLYQGKSPQRMAMRVMIFWESVWQPQWIEPVCAALCRAKEIGQMTVVVSASPQPVLDPLKKQLPIDALCGLIPTIDEHNMYTGKPSGIVTAGQGKRDRADEVSNGADIALAVGNSLLDLEILLAAKTAWMINPTVGLRDACTAHNRNDDWLTTHT